MIEITHIYQLEWVIASDVINDCMHYQVWFKRNNILTFTVYDDLRPSEILFAGDEVVCTQVAVFREILAQGLDWVRGVEEEAKASSVDIPDKGPQE